MLLVPCVGVDIGVSSSACVSLMSCYENSPDLYTLLIVSASLLTQLEGDVTKHRPIGVQNAENRLHPVRAEWSSIPESNKD